MANALRVLALDAVAAANSGHSGMPMGMADVATVLFDSHLRFDPKAPRWHDRDRFVLSAGHGSMLLYGLLHLTGYEDMGEDQIRAFRQLGSRTAGHPEFGHAAGIETTTGPLGQGLANAVGMAIAEEALRARFGARVFDHHTWVIAGDGCLMEGVSQEAITLAGHLALSRLIVLWDDNGISIDGKVSLTDSTDQRARFEASGWVTRAVNAHDHADIEAALAWAKAQKQPVMLACKSHIGFGAPTLQDTAKAHGAITGADEIAGAKAAIGWEGKAPFEIPAAIRADWARAAARGAEARAEWQARFAALTPARQAEIDRVMAGEAPKKLASAVRKLKRRLAEEAPKMATRKASEVALAEINPVMRETIGGSADLTGSNNTRTADLGVFSAADRKGRYIHYGIREHGMAAAMNGIALHGGLAPYGGTFLCFADYARPSIRLSALMGVRTVYVMTHDSIGLGEDGPTHQPVEHLAMLRATPGLNVFRPADAVETAEAWELALSAAGPSVLALTRQNLPAVRTAHVNRNEVGRGAYILAEAEAKRAAVIVATGSEVEIAMAAKAMLEAEEIGTRVVSMPCWELFEAQDETYRRRVLPPGPVRVGVEAAVRTGWDRWLCGERGSAKKAGFVGMEGFGASAPYQELYKSFGITAEAVAAEVRRLL
ncbi:transketolase [Paralimibaculum aggregatum]|nr:transketolase [Limibaculum sp. NKW23]